MTGVVQRLWEQWEHMGDLGPDLDPSEAPRAKEPSGEAPSSGEPSSNKKPLSSKAFPESDAKEQILDADGNTDKGVNSDVVGQVGRSIHQKSGYNNLHVINVGEDGLSTSGNIDSIATPPRPGKQGEEKSTNTNNKSSRKRNKNTNQLVNDEDKTRHFGNILDNVGFTQDCEVNDETEIEPLGLDKTIGAFGVLAMGVSVSAVVLVLEFWVVLGCCGRIRRWCCGQKNNQNERSITKGNRNLNRASQCIAWDSSLKLEGKFDGGMLDYPDVMTKEGKRKRKGQKTTPDTLVFETNWENKLQF